MTKCEVFADAYDSSLCLSFMVVWAECVLVNWWVDRCLVLVLWSYFYLFLIGGLGLILNILVLAFCLVIEILILVLLCFFYCD